LALDPTTRSLLVEMDLPNPDHLLRPGTFAEMAIGLRDIPNALVLPPQAIHSGSKGKSLFVVEQGKAKTVPVETGLTDGKWIEITNGLQGHEDVVVVGKRALLEGSAVHVSPFNLPEASPSRQKFERKSAGFPSPSSTANPRPPAASKQD
jgi:membrane fusion protein (multidrug efflux system)